MKARLAPLALAAVLAGGCAVPQWVPLLGKRTPPTPAPAAAPEKPAPGAARAALPDDDSVIDRVVAVVNNDAITLGEIQEAVAIFRQENRGRGPSDEDLQRDFLGKIIDSRLQLQEADRDRIAVDEAEVTEELADRMKRLGAGSREELEAALKAQGLSMDAVRRSPPPRSTPTWTSTGTSWRPDSPITPGTSCWRRPAPATRSGSRPGSGPSSSAPSCARAPTSPTSPASTPATPAPGTAATSAP
jgi:hypothetical protein